MSKKKVRSLAVSLSLSLCVTLPTDPPHTALTSTPGRPPHPLHPIHTHTLTHRLPPLSPPQQSQHSGHFRSINQNAWRRATLYNLTWLCLPNAPTTSAPSPPTLTAAVVEACRGVKGGKRREINKKVD